MHGHGVAGLGVGEDRTLLTQYASTERSIEQPPDYHRLLSPEHNGLNIHYTDWGNPHLPYMFLAHGAVANAVYWDLVAPAFHDKYHIVAVTARGRSMENRGITQRDDSCFFLCTRLWL